MEPRLLQGLLPSSRTQMNPDPWPGAGEPELPSKTHPAKTQPLAFQDQQIRILPWIWTTSLHHYLFEIKPKRSQRRSPALLCRHPVNVINSRLYNPLHKSVCTCACTHTRTRSRVSVSYLKDTKPQPTKGIMNKHRIIFQFLVSREISPYHCLERKFYRETKTKDTGPH